MLFQCRFFIIKSIASGSQWGEVRIKNKAIHCPISIGEGRCLRVLAILNNYPNTGTLPFACMALYIFSLRRLPKHFFNSGGFGRCIRLPPPFRGLAHNILHPLPYCFCFFRLTVSGIFIPLFWLYHSSLLETCKAIKILWKGVYFEDVTSF